MNKKLSNKNTKSGFTLVEILVVMAIMAIVGTVLVAIFTNTLRGSNKSQILAAIKQNGQAVLDNIDKAMRDADGVVCPPLDDSSNTLVLVKNGRYTRFRFIPSLPGGNGSIQQDSPAPGNDINAFLNTVCTDPSSEGTIILTDTNLRSGVSANWDAGPFTRNREPGFKDSVTVSFKLGPGAGIPPAVANQIDSVVFQTTIQLR